MTNIRGLFLLFIFIIAALRTQAQIFSTDKTKLYTELKEILLQTDKVQGKPYAEKMDKDLKENTIGETRVRMMQEFYTEMAKKRIRIYPAYTTYYDAVFASVMNHRSDAEFALWHQAILSVLKRKTQNPFLDFLTLSQKLFSENIIYESVSVTWKAYGTYQIRHQEGQDPYVDFENLTLAAYAKGDSGVIYNTSGRWYMTENKWEGKGGNVYWERAGLEKDKTYAKLGTYGIMLKSADYKADSVEFMHTEYFTSPVMGELEDKVQPNITKENATYPRFKGYDKTLKLDNLAEGVKYIGGFQLNGNRFLGAGDNQNLALFIFYRDDHPLVKIGSLNYSFRKNTIASDKAEATIYIYKNDTLDSIYQPNLSFKYLTDKKELVLLRTGEGMQKSLYLNTYHNMDMDVEALYWQTDEHVMQLSTVKGSAEGRARFTSANYYKDMLYERLAGLGDSNPLLSLRELYQSNPDRTTFTGMETARKLKADPSHIRHFLMQLSMYGLIAYNTDRDDYVVKDRFYHIVSSRSRLTDYDIIEFNSVIREKNATLSLMDYNLKMRGVGVVLLSDSQQVVIYPHEQEILMKKDMDFSFDGAVTAGRFNFIGKIFDFSYEKFNLNLASVDSVKLRVTRIKPDEFGRYSLVNVKTTIHDVTGDLQIDAPQNKSGLKALGRFPIFTSKQPSYTYYDSKYIADGTYNRNDFYFRIGPFVLDSLDVFPTERLLLDGTLISADIFPDIKDKLKVMPDYSLGIRHITPSLPIYGGPAKYTNEIRLSHDGLRGTGSLEYLTATSESDDFRFYPDSMNALAQKFNVKKSTGTKGTPDIHADSVYIHWEPKTGRYDVKNLGPGFKMYGGEASLDGTVTVTDNGIKGGGTVDLGNAQIEAKDYDFKTEKFISDSADFKLRDIKTESGESGVSFATKNMKSEIDFKERKGKFESNDERSFVDFPLNKYRGFTDKFDWEMDKNDIELRAKKENESEGFRMLSTKHDQDSLEFHTPYALFKASDKVIYAEKVKHIDVADSRIVLSDGKVTVRDDARMDTLMKTSILMPTEKMFFTIKNANVALFGKNKMAGYGIYEYKDKTGRAQNIRMHNIFVDSTKSVKAKGSILESDSLRLMPHVSYKGDFDLYSKNPEPYIRGHITIDHDCPLLTRKWMETKGNIGEGEIMIPVPEDARDDKKNIMFNGFAFAGDSSGIYPVLISGKQFHSDQEVIKAYGFLAYDNKTGEYKVGNKERILNPEAEGSIMVFNPANCSAYGEGKMELGGKLGQATTTAAGRINYLPADTTTELDVVFGINFHLDNTIWDIINNKIKEYNTGNAHLSDNAVINDLGELISDPKERTRFIAKGGANDKLPSELSTTFMFTDVHLFWNKTTRSLQHSGPAGILSVNGKMFNKAANLKMEIERKRSGDAIHIYIEFDSENWYYFSYRNNIMYISSSHSTEINSKILEMDPKKRVVEGKNGVPNYTFTLLNSKRQLERWLEKF